MWRENLYLEEKLVPLQSGFCPGFSTQTDLIKITNDIRATVDHKKNPRYTINTRYITPFFIQSWSLCTFQKVLFFDSINSLLDAPK